jgi:flagellar basal-body rod protein FlgF
MIGEIAGVLSGAIAQETRLEVLSNNIANVSTVGFKEDRVFRIPTSATSTSSSIWDSIPNASMAGISVDNISSLEIGTFTNFEQGSLKETGNALDLGLDGKGFFAVRTPNGTQYTRKGNFALNGDGTLVTQEGYPVLGKNGGQIQITGQQVSIGADGSIQVDGSAVDTLNIVDFPNKNTLMKYGDSLYSPQNANDQGEPASSVLVRQGVIEMSNVDSIRAMTEMIDVVRGFESYQKVLQSINETTTKTVNDVGKLT